MSGAPRWTDNIDLLALTGLLGAAIGGETPAAPGQPHNWVRIVTLAQAHGTGGVLHRAVIGGHAPDMPLPLAHVLARHAAASTRRNHGLLVELQRLRGALAGAGVETIPLKGVWLGQRLYGDVATRVSRDIDFLVRHEATGAALQALTSAGYGVHPALPPRQLAAKARYAGQFLMHSHDGGFAIEPHWALAPHTLSLGLDHGGLWQRRRMVVSDGLEMPALAAEDEFIMLCVHGFKEDWSRIKLMVDLARFVQAHPALDWGAVAARAVQQRVWWIVLVGARMIWTMFGLETGLHSAVLRTAQPECVARHLLARITKAAPMPHQVPSERNIYQLAATRWRIRERRLDRARYIWRTVATPREAHFLALRLPEWLHPAYVPFKLLHDYLLLPCWLLAKRMRKRDATVLRS